MDEPLQASSGRVALDEVKKREVLAIISVGGVRQTAADYVGCHVNTIRNAAERDPSFAARLHAAESKHEILHLSNINKAASEPRYWRAAAWALERIRPDRYGPRRPNVVTLDQIDLVLTQVADVLVEEIPDEECRARILARIDALIVNLRMAEAMKESETPKPPLDSPDGGEEGTDERE